MNAQDLAEKQRILVLDVINGDAKMMRHLLDSPCHSIVIGQWLALAVDHPGVENPYIGLFPIPDSSVWLPEPINGQPWEYGQHWRCGVMIQFQAFMNDWLDGEGEAAAVHHISDMMRKSFMPSVAQMEIEGVENASDRSLREELYKIFNDPELDVKLTDPMAVYLLRRLYDAVQKTDAKDVVWPEKILVAIEESRTVDNREGGQGFRFPGGSRNPFNRWPRGVE